MRIEHAAGTVQARTGARTSVAQDVQHALPASSSGGTPSHVSSSAKSDAAVLKKAVAAIEQAIQPHFGSIEFSIDENSGKTLLKVIDRETNTLLMQIPSKQALALAQSFGNLKGVLIKDSA